MVQINAAQISRVYLRLESLQRVLPHIITMTCEEHVVLAALIRCLLSAQIKSNESVVPHSHLSHFSHVAFWETHHVTQIFTHVVDHILNLSKRHYCGIHNEACLMGAD